jgi:putative (di)nucleoside polyphosphate hydrolase
MNNYRRGIGIVLVNDDRKVFIGRRSGVNQQYHFNQLNSTWQMPQGGIDDGETPEEAVLREMHEEIGTQKGEIIATSQTWLSYDFPDPIRKNIWGGKFEGQTQKWFLIRFLGCDSDINLTLHIQEFEEWKWASAEQAMSLVIDFKKNVYQKIFEEFNLLNT